MTDFHNCDGHCAYCDKPIRKKCPIYRNYNETFGGFICLSILFLLFIVYLSFASESTYADTINIDNDLVQIDYVEISSSTQLLLPLDTPFNTNSSDDSLTFILDGNLKNNSWQVAPFGSYNNTTDRGVFFLVNPSTGKYSIQYGNSWSEGSSSALGGSRHTFMTHFSYGSQYLNVDGSTYASFSYKPSQSYTVNQISLFQRELTGSATAVCDLRGTIYNIVIRHNGNIIYNLLPCYKRSTESLGLYDTISHNFYEVNKGAFLYDGEIPPLGGIKPPISDGDGNIIPPHNGNDKVEQHTVMQGLFHIYNDIWVKLSQVIIPIIELPYTVVLIGIFIIYKTIDAIKEILHSNYGGE